MGVDWRLGMIGITASQAFVPNKGSGLSFWLDGSDLGTLTDSAGDLSAWDDKSKNNIDFTQGTGLNQPQTGGTPINGKNVINFNGTSHFMVASSNSTNKIIFFVLRLETGFPDFSGVFNQTGNDLENIRIDADNVRFRASGNDENIADFSFSGGEIRINGTVTTDPVVTLNTPFILSEVSPSGNTFIPQISQDFNDRFWKGDIAEAFAYDVEPSSDFMIQILDYSRNKWGISINFPFTFSSDFSEDFN